MTLFNPQSQIRNRKSLPALFLLGLLATGCNLLPQRPFTPTRYHALDPPAPAARPDAKPPDLVLAVRTLDAESRYRDRIYFRKTGAVAGYHDFDRWVQTPGETLSGILRRSLEAAGIARAVVEDRLVRRPDVTLDGRVTRFDEVHGDAGWAAESEIEIVLKDADASVLLLSARIASRHEAKAKTTAAFVEAMTAAVADVTAKATDAVAKALAARKPAK